MKNLDELRKEIDAIDSSILELLEKRMTVTDQVGEFKKENNISILQKNREQNVKETLQNGTRHPILKDRIDGIYQQIIETAKLSMHIQHLTESPFKRIAIIGFGVIGGSIAKTLKAKNASIIISTIKRDSKDIQIALETKILDQQFETIEELVQNNELIIIASPIDTVKDLTDKIAQNTPQNKVIVIDVASVKEEISQIFEQKTNDSIEFLPTHPMAGSENAGFNGSTVGMFIGKPWVMCKHDKSKDSTVELVKNFIESVGSNVVMMDAQTHDRSAAIVSHLIFVISTYLFAFSNMTPQALTIAGSGFESTTRLASGNVHMHEQIMIHNLKNISEMVQKFVEYIQKNPVTAENAQTFYADNKKARDEFIQKK